MMAAVGSTLESRDALRELLEARRQEASEALQVRMARMRERGESALIATESDEDGTGDLDVVLVEVASGVLRRIDDALERLDRGIYGRCTRCQGPIAKARLYALPFAVCCQQCEAVREHEVAAVRVSDRKRTRRGPTADDTY
jgi:RNA polymerase-binding transcription factor DksA